MFYFEELLTFSSEICVHIILNDYGPSLYGQFTYRLATTNVVAISCQTYEFYDADLMFCFQNTSFQDKLLKRVHSDKISFLTKDEYRPFVRQPQPKPL